MPLEHRIQGSELGQAVYQTIGEGEVDHYSNIARPIEDIVHQLSNAWPESPLSKQASCQDHTGNDGHQGAPQYGSVELLVPLGVELSQQSKILV